MNYIKISTGLICSFLILCTLVIFIENPEEKLFEKTVKTLMVQEGLSSFQEAIDSFPVLENIKSKMNQIGQLNHAIQRITGGPAPNVSREQSQQIQGYAQDIRQLRISIKEELSQLLVNDAHDEP